MGVNYETRRSNALFSFARFAFLAIAAIVTILPFLWLVSTAFKTEAQVFRMPLTLIPPM